MGRTRPTRDAILDEAIVCRTGVEKTPEPPTEGGAKRVAREFSYFISIKKARRKKV